MPNAIRLSNEGREGARPRATSTSSPSANLRPELPPASFPIRRTTMTAAGTANGPGRDPHATRHHRAQRRPHRRRAAAAASSSTPATGPCRSARTCTCPTPTPRWTSTASRHTASGWTSRPAPPVGSSPARRGGRRGRRGLAGVRHPVPGRRSSTTVRRRGAEPWWRSPARTYAALYGPTVGDQVRLGDTDLWIEVEQDLPPVGRRPSSAAASRSASRWRRAPRTSAEGAPDTVITNAIVLDHWGIVRADVGIRDGRIVALGRAGNPDIADGVHPELQIGPSTDVISGEGKILTAGGFDSHVHLLSPVADPRGAGHRADHHRRRRHRAQRGHRRPPPSPRGRGTWSRCTAALDPLPVNVLLLGKGNTVSCAGPWPSRRWPAPAATRCTRTGAPPRPPSTRRCAAADELGLQVALHSDSLNEAGYVESTIAAIAGRSIHAFHAEGAGGGHAPDILTRLRRCRTCCPARPTRRCRTPSTPSPSTSTC